MQTTRSPLFLISLLGALSVISPFAIDLYLPAYQQVAASFNVANTVVALTLSSYFIGMAMGQVFYGPLLDRFGRKRPLLGGLMLFILASVGGAFAPTIHALIGLRFIQAFGGCVAGVASLAMVRDFFPAADAPRILSRLFLFIAISPLLAPSTGGLIALAFGWKMVFILLALIVTAIAALIFFLLPEGHVPDTTISLKPGPILREYGAIIRHPRFITYALSGAFSFAGLFTYVAGSPIIFMENFHLSARIYSGIFALLATGFIGGSQLNVALLKRHSSETLFQRVLTLQVLTGIIFALGTYLQLYGLIATLILFYLYLSCAGITYPNAAALAITPFTKNAGSASALLGFIQLGLGAIVSTFISAAPPHDSFPIILILAVSSLIGIGILFAGRKRAMHCAIAE